MCDGEAPSPTREARALPSVIRNRPGYVERRIFPALATAQDAGDLGIRVGSSWSPSERRTYRIRSARTGVIDPGYSFFE